MIIYFDNGKNPFTPLFSACGEPLIMPYYRKLKIKVIRKLEKLPFIWNFLYNKKEIVPKPDETIIVFDSNMSGAFLQWLKKKFPDNRIIFWYWNPVRTTFQPDAIPEGIERWSYSPEDCEKYGLKYNTTFYFDTLVENLPTTRKTGKKVLFVGRDKGRLSELLEWKHSLEKQGLECDFYIIGQQDPSGFCIKSELGYDEVFRLIMESDIIIDYYTDPNAGLSLRPMEAMFLEKKLITNNITIRNYDFYSDSNIFICQNSFDGIQSFISKEYQTVKKEIKDQYLLSSWKASFDR